MKSINNYIKESTRKFDSIEEYLEDIVNSSKKDPDELEVLFSKYKDILSDKDKEYMKFIINQAKREIDKQLGEIE